MKGLRLFLSPFTPDQSGATSVFYGYNGMTVMLDAGGCIGNTCGFDEPRWNDKPGAIFSAALRDLDAILGRDELLIEKVIRAIRVHNAEFIVLIGTPVTSVIGTDYRALTRLMEKEFGIPVLSVATDGMKLYDIGIEKAYLELFKTFAASDFDGEGRCEEKSRIGVIGALPLDTFAQDISELKKEIASMNSGFGEDLDIICYGNGDALSDVKRAGSVKKNIVISPAGIKAAKFLEKKFGIAYEARLPLDDKIKKHIKELIEESGISECTDKRILVVHQQFFASSIREFIVRSYPASSIRVASWFKMIEEYMEEGDSVLKEEGDLRDLVLNNEIDVVIGDPLLERLLFDMDVKFISLPHYAISGILHEVREY